MKDRPQEARIAIAIERSSRRADGALVTKAMLRAARRLGLSNKELARILGLPESAIARMARGTRALARQRKPYKSALLLVRLCQSLDAIFAGDAGAARAWLRANNSALGDAPMARIAAVDGLTETLGYLDARRARA
jgi:transcriptional regulator with XRE-family HTH domain